jgi:hypothetical protein
MKAKIKKLDKEFINDLRLIGVELVDNAKCFICKYRVIIGVKYNKNRAILNPDSQIDIFKLNSGKYEINFGTGAFSKDDKIKYWRTIHAASILKNWIAVCKLIDKYTLLIKKLEQ